MTYTPTSWTEVTPRSTDNLNNMETQYDEAVDYGFTIRASSTAEIRAQTSTSAPVAGNEGRLYFNTDNDTLYVDDGTDWRSVGKSMIIAVKYYSVDLSAQTTNLTIDAVDRDTSVIEIMPRYGGDDDTYSVTAQFTSDTQVTLYRRATTPTMTVGVRVIEFEPGVVKSIQRDHDVSMGATTNNITVSSVDPEKCLIYFNYQSQVVNGIRNPTVELTTATNLQVIFASVNATKFSYEIVELY